MNNQDIERYFKKAKDWDSEIVANALISRNRAWMVASMALILSCLSLITLLLILPLKTFEPYVISVDRNTGYYEVARGLKDSALTADQAITESNLVRYVSLREQYNPAILKDSYNKVVMMSGKGALKEFKTLWGPNNPENPSIKLGQKAAIEIKIKSVSFISKNIASIRFIEQQTAMDTVKTSHWNAVLEFQYVQKPLKMKERFENPLGFQVINYRVNPESLENFK